MVLLFLIYGFSFFVLSLSILIYPKAGSRFDMARRLWLIAGFGLTHGANEWVDMFMLIRADQDNFALEAAHLVLLPVSFMFLVCFGVLMLRDLGQKGLWLKLLPWVLGMAWGVVFILSEDRFLMGDIFSRYLLCIPGTFLTALVLCLKIPKMEKTRFAGVAVNLKLAALTILGYGFFGGVMVDEADFFPATIFNYGNFRELAGFPVQVVRAGCALLNAYFMVRLLGIFHWESRQALNESELRFHTIVETAPLILFMEDQSEEISYIKGRGLAVLGLEADELLGQPMSALFPEVPQIETARRRATEGYESVFQFCVRGISFEARISPLTNECGEVTGLIGIAVDISEQEEIRAEREKYLAEIGKNQRLVELGMISTKMVQEIAEPLSMTHLLMERLLTEYDGSADKATISQTIKKGFSEISKVTSILERFNYSAQLKHEDKVRPIDLYQLGRRMMEVFGNSALNARLRMALKDMDLVVYMSMPERELEQVFFILIQNAIDAADRGDCEDLTVSCQAEEKQITLLFNDTCRGMSLERREDIFGAKYGEKYELGGKGMGMAVARHLVISHSGEIEVESEEGRGSTFKVVLPVERIG